MREADLDGLMLIFPEYDADMLLFGETVLPALRAHDEESAARSMDAHLHHVEQALAQAART